MGQERFDLEEDLPCLGQTESFRFCCDASQPCFNRCCAQLNLPLTPYDSARLATALKLPPSRFLRTFAGIYPEENTGFPQAHLRMLDKPGAPCPFVRPGGCAVYQNRPAACRSYPLGRGARLGREGVLERYFLIEEPHCLGFGQGRDWTAPEWFQAQGLEPYNNFSDRYMRLLSLVAASGRPLDERLRALALLSLWQLDKFRAFLCEMDAFSSLDLRAHKIALIMENTPLGDYALLGFGLDWLELVIFGECAGLGANEKEISGSA